MGAVAQLPPDPVAEELLGAGWERTARDGWWRDPTSRRSYPEGDALRVKRMDVAQACDHQALAYAADVLTDVEGAVRVVCSGCGWARTATRAS